MDSATAKKERVARQIELVKAHMPKTYQHIKDRAESMGANAWTLVRRGMAGEANCFYAVENRCVVGAPFDRSSMTDMFAGQIVRFGCEFLAIGPDGELSVKGQGDGAH